MDQVKIINENLENYLNKRLEVFTKASINTKQLIQEIREFVLRGGKRIRARLLLMSFEGYAPKYLSEDLYKQHQQAAMQAAIATELIQAFFLIHDDIMDSSDLRRGALTFHKQMEKEFDFADNQRKFGESMAILAGDLLYSLGFDCLLSMDIDPKLQKKIQTSAFATINTTCMGQIDDVFFADTPLSQVDKEDIMRVYTNKSGVYTIESPLSIGAHLAHVDDSETMKIARLSKFLGTAFQMVDDILGLYGDEKEVGKSVISDVVEGKKTLLMKYAAERSSDRERELLDTMLGNKYITETQFSQVQNIVRSSGALDMLKKDIGRNTLESKRIIKTLDMVDETKDQLLALADKLQTRTK